METSHPADIPIPTPDRDCPRIVMASNPLNFYLEMARLHIGWGVCLLDAINAREYALFGEGGFSPFTLGNLVGMLIISDTYLKVLRERGVFEEGEGRKPGTLLEATAEGPPESWEPSLRDLDAAVRHFEERYWPMGDHCVFVATMVLNTLETYANEENLARLREDFRLTKIQERLAEAMRNGAMPAAAPGAYTGDHKPEHERSEEDKRWGFRPLDSLGLHANYARMNIAWGVRLLEAIHIRRLELQDERYCRRMNLPPPDPLATPLAATPEWTVYDALQWLVFEQAYDEGLLSAEVVRWSDSGSEEAEQFKPVFVPGQLLAGIEQPKERWTRGTYFLDAALRYLKKFHWDLPCDTCAAVRALIHGALGAYPPDAPLRDLARDFRLENTNQEVLALLNADWLS